MIYETTNNKLYLGTTSEVSFEVAVPLEKKVGQYFFTITCLLQVNQSLNKSILCPKCASEEAPDFFQPYVIDIIIVGPLRNPYKNISERKMQFLEKLPPNPSDTTPVGVEVSVPGKKVILYFFIIVCLFYVIKA